MSDINITLDEAIAWIAKVEKEMEAANEVLKQATECVKDFQDKDDTIYKEMVKASESYESAWAKLKSAYKDVIVGLKAAFSAQIAKIEELVEAIKEEARKVKC